MRFSLRRSLQRVRRFFTIHIVLTLVIGVVLGIILIKVTDNLFGINTVIFNGHKVTTTPRISVLLSAEELKRIKSQNNPKNISKPSKSELHSKWLQERIARMSKRVISNNDFEMIYTDVQTNYNVHIFYYAWYGTPEIDGNWQHWNHKYLENWQKSDGKVYPTGHHSPPEDIGSNFYPQSGCYSSRDSKIISRHMRQIKSTGIGVLIVSWYPPDMSDNTNKDSSPDTVFRILLDAAEKHDLKVAPHIEPYKDRNPINFKVHLKYFITQYGNHTGLYRMKRKNTLLPVFYIYDSYLTPAASWKEIFGTSGDLSLRGTSNDGIFLGLLVEQKDRVEIKRAQFDGFYTYFAANGFTYGSTWKNWKSLSVFAKQNQLFFFPSLGPGYIDTQVRPWNAGTTRHRRNGKYYGVSWRTAMAANVDGIGVTSFNEWHEGTQIEPAIPYRTEKFTYLDYSPQNSDFYLNLTKWWVSEYSKISNKHVYKV